MPVRFFTEFTWLARILSCDKTVAATGNSRNLRFSFGVAITTTSSMSTIFSESFGKSSAHAVPVVRSVRAIIKFFLFICCSFICCKVTANIDNGQSSFIRICFTTVFTAEDTEGIVKVTSSLILWYRLFECFWEKVWKVFLFTFFILFILCILCGESDSIRFYIPVHYRINSQSGDGLDT